MQNDSALREQLVALLHGGHAHATFDDVVKDFPPADVGKRPAGAPHSAWELLEHIRIAQNDILRFSRSADYQSPKFPEGYWPASPAPGDPTLWNDSVSEVREDLAAFVELLRDKSRDLHAPFPWGDGQTLFREALLIADHNSYHLGQLVLLRRLLHSWRA